MALKQQRRGADIAKLVSGATTREQQIENMRIINLLKENLEIPFLFLSTGDCRILRRVGGALGNCMSLCVYEHDAFSTSEQPLLRDMKLLHNLI
jgi:3-dehydroquinate dehydratase